MASTFTVNTGIELIANGEKSGTWGDTTNLNLEIIDRLTNGVGSITLSGTTHTLTTTDGELSDGQFKVLVFGGTPSGTNTVTISPNDQDKQFFIVNNSGQSIILTQGSGTSVTVPNGAKDIVFADGGGAGANVANFSADLSGVLLAANNLSDLGSAAVSLTNLGLTATAAELNILDGVTATAAELNILDGVTATTAELNKLDGVAGDVVGTSDAQTLTNKNIIRDVEIIAANTNADASVLYVITADLTLTLPATPTVGSQVHFSNRSGLTTPIIARNGENIMSVAEDLTLDDINAFGALVFADTTRGWVFQ